MSDAAFSMLDLFCEEVRSYTVHLNEGLLRLESAPAEPQALELLMRAAHSIKGAARIVGVEPGVRLAHALEDAFVAAQQGKIHLAAGDIDVCLRAADVLGSLADVREETLPQWTVDHEAAVGDLATLLSALAQGRLRRAPSSTTT